MWSIFGVVFHWELQMMSPVVLMLDSLAILYVASTRSADCNVRSSLSTFNLSVTSTSPKLVPSQLIPNWNDQWH